MKQMIFTAAGDGRFNGNLAQEGVYCYLIKGKEYNRKGTIAIIR
jgi:hypothetical protein